MGCNIRIKQEKRKHPTQVTIEQMDALVSEAEKNLSASKRIQEDLGINREALQQFTELPNFNEADRAKAKQAVAEWQEELDRDAKIAAEEARLKLSKRGAAETPSKPTRAAMRRTRV